MNDFDYLVLYAICAFYDYDDFYCHFSLQNLSLCGVGQTTLSATIKKLCQIGMLQNCTVNGFYNRYIVNCYFPCPDFIFNNELPVRVKQFLCRCIRYKSQLCNKMTSREVHKLLYGNNSYKKTANNMSILKSYLGKSLFEYLQDYSYVEAVPFDNRYPLIKKDNGYYVDSESAKRQYNLSMSKECIRIKNKKNLEERIQRQGVGHYLMKKVRDRIRNDIARFKDSDIDEEFLNDLYHKQNCCDYYTGLPFDCLQQISVDRIDSSRPYMKDNVVLTTATINIMKFTQNISDFIEKCHQISNHFTKGGQRGFLQKPNNQQFASSPIFKLCQNAFKVLLLCNILHNRNDEINVITIQLLSKSLGLRLSSSIINKSLKSLNDIGVLSEGFEICCDILHDFNPGDYQKLFCLNGNQLKFYLLYYKYYYSDCVSFKDYLKQNGFNYKNDIISRNLSKLSNLGLLFKSSRGNYVIL